MTTNTRAKSIKFTVDEWTDIEKAAEAAHLTTHAWIRIVVNAALGSALPEQLERLIPKSAVTPYSIGRFEK
jgi:hypothetical protein